jgi:hypothetical protein
MPFKLRRRRRELRERCGYRFDDALSEVRLRARVRRKKAELKDLEREGARDRRESADAAEAAGETPGGS